VLIIIVCKEILEKVLSLRFFIAVVMCIILLPGVILLRTAEYTKKAAKVQKEAEANMDHIRNYPVESSYRIRGATLTLPSNILGIFSEGCDARDGTAVELVLWRDPNFQSTYSPNPFVELLPTFDFVLFVGLMMSLLALVFSYDAISGELERGTLKLMLSGQLPRSTLLLAKWIGGLAVVTVPFLISFLISLLIVILYPGVQMTPGDWIAVLLAFFISLVYIAAIFSLGLFISCITSRAATSIALLLLFWVGLCWIIPNYGRWVVTQIIRLPTVSAIEREKSTARREAEEWGWKAYQKYAEEHPEEAKTWYSMVVYRSSMVKGDERFAEALDKIDANYRNLLNMQVGLGRVICKVSPFAVYTDAVTEVTGTGIRERVRLLQAVRRYRHAFFDYAGQEFVEHSEKKWEVRQKGTKEWPRFRIGDFPIFSYQESRLRDKLKSSSVDIMLLLVWNVIFFIGAYTSFLRRSVA
jgi:ABC-type transport system involved in multi-copper enzyme maturation permease subunit